MATDIKHLFIISLISLEIDENALTVFMSINKRVKFQLDVSTFPAASVTLKYVPSVGTPRPS